METEGIILTASAVFLSGMLLLAVMPRRVSHLAYYIFALGSLLFGLSALQGLLFADAWSLSAPISGFLALGFRADQLSSFFGLTLSILGFAVSLYSTGYSKNAVNPRSQGALYGLFLLSMYAVFYASNIVTFLISWETMSLSSYFLVVSDTRDEAAGRAGLIYAVMTHIGTAAIILAFMLLYGSTGSMDFATIKAGAGAVGAVKSAVFILAVLGFGTKAGIVPLHTWLPLAHPAAPSNVSALMSGVMIKAGIYGMLRVCLDILGGDVAWWGVTLLAAGAVSSVLGVMYALMEHDIKRLLAFSSVENIGIILLGMGASVVFTSCGLSSLAGLALAASLYHVINHAMFKGLLFMGAGSVLHATHTKNMEEMGGLIKRMPWTGLFFLMGSVSICALPPFNGFISEWLTFQSLILGIKSNTLLTKVLMLSGGAALALTGALAAAAFVKAFGISFLGMPRGDNAAHAKEASSGMVAGMAVPALLCLLLGVFPGVVLRLVSAIPLCGLPSVSGLPQEGMSISVEGGFASLSPVVILLLMAITGVSVYALTRALGGRAKINIADPWDCGIRRLTPKMQYTATAFTKPLRVIFKSIYLPRRDLKIRYAAKPFFPIDITYHSDVTPVFEQYLYSPVIRGIHGAARRVRGLQSGSLHLYLGYILVTLVALLLIWG